jgi:hypothetical protein
MPTTHFSPNRVPFLAGRLGALPQQLHPSRSPLLAPTCKIPTAGKPTVAGAHLLPLASALAWPYPLSSSSSSKDWVLSELQCRHHMTTATGTARAGARGPRPSRAPATPPAVAGPWGRSRKALPPATRLRRSLLPCACRFTQP